MALVTETTSATEVNSSEVAAPERLDTVLDTVLDTRGNCGGKGTPSQVIVCRSRRPPERLAAELDAFDAKVAQVGRQLCGVLPPLHRAWRDVRAAS